MKIESHGLSIGIERISNRFFLTMRVVGKLTHEDYETITPMIDSALDGVNKPVIHAFVDLREFDGWDLRAAWDDFKLGLKHGREFEKIAILANKPWEKVATRIASWFISGEAKYFDNIDEAYIWLDSKD